MINLILLVGLFYVMYRITAGMGLFNTTTNNNGVTNVTPYDIELNLLTLSSLVIKADGYIKNQEQDFVREYFVNKYGKDRANATFKTFNTLIKNRDIAAHRVCYFLLHKTTYAERIDIVQFLFQVAMSDGYISYNETIKIEEIAGFLRVYHDDYEKIRVYYYIKEKQLPKPPNAYKILNLETTATDAEVKKAYRSLVKQYHPDKLIDENDYTKKNAEEKFRSVQQAYEYIQKERGF